MSEWKEKKITEYSTIISGTTPSTTIDEFWNGDIIWITPVDLSTTSSRIIDTSDRKITKKGLANSSRQLIPENSIVMSSRAPIGYFAISTNEYATNQGCKSFVLKKDQSPDFHYYNFILNKNKFINLGSGSTFQEISKTSIEKLKFTIPTTLPEQRAIASVLTTIDQAIEATKKIIAKRRRVKEGLMQDLFRYGLDEKGNLRSEKTHAFKDSALGRIPVEWEVSEMWKIATIKGRIGWRGYTYEDLTDEGPLVIGGTQINKDHKLDFSNPVYLSRKKFLESPEIMISLGDILLVKTGNTIGKVAFVDKDIGEACINPNTALFKEIKCDPAFLYYTLIHFDNQKQIWDFVAAGAQPAVNQKNIKCMIVKLPAKQKEQSRIASMLILADKAIVKEKTILSKLKSQKRGLMEDLLTGKVRVTNKMIKEYENGESYFNQNGMAQ